MTETKDRICKVCMNKPTAKQLEIMLCILSVEIARKECKYCECSITNSDNVCVRCHSVHDLDHACDYCTDTNGTRKPRCYYCGGRDHKPSAHQCKCCSGPHRTFEHIGGCEACGKVPFK